MPIRMSTSPLAVSSRIFFVLGGRDEARDHLDPHRPAGHPRAHRRDVLEGEDRRRHQDRDLPPFLDDLEGGAQGDLGLAVADVAAQQAVHRRRLHQVGLDVGQRGRLVVGQVVREGRLELALPGRVGAEGGGAHRAALRVELQQLARHLLDRRADLGPALVPARRPEPVERHQDLLAAGVLLDQVEPRHRDEEPVARGVLQEQHLVAGAGAAGQSGVAADAVVDVDDEVAFLQVAQVGEEGLAAAALLRRRRRRIGAEEVGLGEQQRAVVPELDAALERAVGQHDLARRGGPGLVLVGLAARHAAGREHFLEALAAAAGPHDQGDGTAGGARGLEVLRQLVEVPAVGARRPAAEVDRAALARAGQRQLGEHERGVGELLLDFGRLDEQLARRGERVPLALLPRGLQLLPARGQLVGRLLRLPGDERAAEQRRQRDDVGAVERGRPLEAGERFLEHQRQAVVGRRRIGEQRARAAHQAVEQVVGFARADRRLARREQREAVDARARCAACRRRSGGRTRPRRRTARREVARPPAAARCRTVRRAARSRRAR